MKSRRLFEGSDSRHSGSRIRFADDIAALEVLRDKEGLVAFGWVADNVLYTRFQKGLSADTGYAYAVHLVDLIASAQRICFFCDSSELNHYDLLARSAFARVVLSNRRKFKFITMLTSAEGLSPTVKTLAATLGEPIEVMTNNDKFVTRLSRQAPMALRMLDPKMWVAATRSPATAR